MATINNLGWEHVEEIQLSEDERNYKGLEIKREDLVSAENGFISKYQMVLVKSSSQNEYTNYGEVLRNRPFIKYSDAVNWLNGQISQITLPIKLKTSSLEGNGKALFQQYLFNQEIKAPDGLSIYPSLIFRASVIGPRPALEVHFGAYRVICENGLITSHPGVKSSYFAVTPQNWKGFKSLEIRTFIQRSFDKINNMSKSFTDLYNSSLSDKKNDIFSEKLLPLSLRKNVISVLEHSDNVEVNIKTKRKKEPIMKASHLKEFHLSDDFINDSIVLKNDTSLWNVYNSFISTVSHNSLLSAKFITDSQRVNETFIRKKQESN